MIPVYQTILAPHLGNCFSAAVASILERQLDTVPFFMDKLGDWWEGFQHWCLEGFVATYYPTREYARQSGTRYLGIPLGFSLMSGESPRFRGCLHTVVALDGVMIHDPYPPPDGGKEVGESRDYITMISKEIYGR